MDYCGQTNIPTTDNTPLECEKFISTDCIIYEGGIPYFGFVDDSTSTEVFDAIILSLTDVRSRVAIIELNASNLDHGTLLGLEDDDHTIYHTDARALAWLATRSTTDLPEGTNLYFTEPRVLATILTGFVAGAGTITSADSVLTALQKAQGALALVPDETSDLTNDGADGVNPFISALDLPVNTDDLNNNGDDGVNPFIDATDLPVNTSELVNDGEDTVNPFINATDLPVATHELTNSGEDGINPYISALDVAAGYVPYVGATANVNLGLFAITTTGNISATKHITHGGTAQHFTKGDGSLDANVYSTATKTSDLTNDGEDQVNPYITLLDIPADLYLGVYATLGALQTAHPTALAGNYANVDLGIGENVERYLWDVDDTAWVLGEGTHTTNTSELVNDGEDGVNPFITLQDLPETADLIDEVTVGENVALGDVLYLSNDGKWWKANAGIKATSTTEVRISLGTILADAVGTVLIKGSITLSGLVAGDKYWLDTTSGLMTTDVSGFADTNIVRYIGTAVSATELEYNPDKTSITRDGKDINDVILYQPISTAELVNEGETDIGRYVEDWEVITAATDSDTVLYSGDAVWLYDYVYYVWADRYKLDGELRTTFIDATITLDAAHGTLNRFDIFKIVSDGALPVETAVHTIVKETGTAAADPTKPTLDAALELEISFAYVGAATTQPEGGFSEVVYAEGGDWTITGGDVSINEANTVTPITDTQDIKWTATPSDTSLFFTRPSGVITTDGYKMLTLDIKLTTPWEWVKKNRTTIDFYLLSSGIRVTKRLRLGSDFGFGFDGTITGTVQTVTVRLDRFGDYFKNNDFDGIEFRTQRTDSDTFQVDNIRIVDNGVAGPVTPGGTVNTHTSQLINDGSDGTSTYVENDEIGLVANSNDYNDLDNKPIFKVVENEYADMATMYADQGNQTDTFIQYVADASGHPDVTSGEAWFEYLGTTVGDDTDYRLLSSAESAPYQSQVTKTSDITNDGENGTDPFVTAKTVPVYIGFAASDETTGLEVGDEVITFRMPFAMTLTDVIITVNTAPTGSTFIADIEESGVTIFSTLPSIDIGEESSQTAAVPPVLSDTSMAAGAELFVNIDQVGSTVAGTGFKVWLVGNRT